MDFDGYIHTQLLFDMGQYWTLMGRQVSPAFRSNASVGQSSLAAVASSIGWINGSMDGSG